MRLRAAAPAEAPAVQALWERSHAVDDPASWSRGGWSVSAWATQTRVLDVDGRIVGMIALRADPAPDGAMPLRVALELAERTPERAVLLVTAGKKKLEVSVAPDGKITKEEDKSKEKD